MLILSRCSGLHPFTRYNNHTVLLAPTFDHIKYWVPNILMRSWCYTQCPRVINNGVLYTMSSCFNRWPCVVFNYKKHTAHIKLNTMLLCCWTPFSCTQRPHMIHNVIMYTMLSCDSATHRIPLSAGTRFTDSEANSNSKEDVDSSQMTEKQQPSSLV